MFTAKEAFKLNIFICTGSRSKEYEIELKTEIRNQNLKFKILKDLSELENIDVIIYSDDCEIIDFAIFPKSTYVFSTFAGVEKTLNNTTIIQPLVRMIDDEMTESMAEWCTAHVMRYHLSLDRFINKNTPEWLRTTEEPLLANQRSIGILGLGTLGEATAQKLQRLGFIVRGWSNTRKKITGIESHTGDSGLKKVLGNSDFLILLLPLTSKTKNIINKNSINLFKDGAKLINAGRGGLIEEESLREALDSGKLSECTLDVFNKEPLPKSHWFWYNKKITITPHISAPTRIGSSVKAMIENMKKIQLG